MNLEPVYFDICQCPWQGYTGKELASTGRQGPLGVFAFQFPHSYFELSGARCPVLLGHCSVRGWICWGPLSWKPKAVL